MHSYNKFRIGTNWDRNVGVECSEKRTNGVEGNSTVEILNVVSEHPEIICKWACGLACVCSFLWQEETLLQSDKERNKHTKNDYYNFQRKGVGSQLTVTIIFHLEQWFSNF